MRRSLSLLSLAGAAVLALAGCGSSGSSATSSSAAASSAPATASASDGASAPSSAAAGGPITIAAFNFGESKILANMYAGALAKAGYQPEVKELTNREVVQPALSSGQVQVVPEYLSTLTEFLNTKANGPNAAPLASGDVDKTLAALKPLAAAQNITPLTPSPATDQNAFAVTKQFATDHNLKTLSDLAAYSQSNPVTLGGPPECPKRPFCQPGLEKTYGMKIGNFRSLDAGGPLTKQALKQGQIDVGLVFSSDGGVAAQDLVVLEDDKKLQNADNIVAAVNSSAVTPQLQAALDAVAAALTTDQLIQLNKAVDIDRKDPQQVAQEWLQSKGLG